MVKNVQKSSTKLRKLTKGKVKTKRENSGSCGFAQKVDITDNFKTFIVKHCNGSLTDNKISRQEASSYVHAYIKKHDLKNPEEKRIILPDKNLKAVLSPLNDEIKVCKSPWMNGKSDKQIGYTFFNLQRYLKQNYVTSA